MPTLRGWLSQALRRINTGAESDKFQEMWVMPEKTADLARPVKGINKSDAFLLFSVILLLGIGVFSAQILGSR
jgi:hypothetical protein